MTRQSTVDTLKVMRFSAMAEEFERQLADPNSIHSFPLKTA